MSRDLMRHVSDRERRARLGVRHALAPSFNVGSPEAVVSAMTVLHATEPTTVHLSCRARAPGATIDDVDHSLYSARSLVKQLAMRRTLFVFPRDLLEAAWGSASARVATAQRTRMVKDIVDSGVDPDGEAWLERARAEVLRVLSEHPEGLTARELRTQAPAIAAKIEPSTGEPWSASRILVYLGARADILRGENVGDWLVSRPRWTLTRHWLGEDPVRHEATDGYRELVRRWLRSFGPGSEEDLVWWLGSTKTAVRRALADLDAVEVSLDRGERGFLLPDDLDPVQAPGPWVALLPVLDPTTMGWRGRDFYLGPHASRLFDSAGNAGTTAWVDGRVVGCWVQDDAGAVQVRLLERVPPRARSALRSEAAKLTAWLAGTRIRSSLQSPAMRAARTS